MAREVHSIFTNEGATSSITITLPLSSVGQRYRFAVVAPFPLTVSTYPSVPQEIIRRVGGTSTSLSSSQVGSYLELVCIKTGEWLVTVNNGFA